MFNMDESRSLWLVMVTLSVVRVLLGGWSWSLIIFFGLPIIYSPFHIKGYVRLNYVLLPNMVRLLPVTWLGFCQLHCYAPASYMVRLLLHTVVIPATHVLLPIIYSPIYIGVRLNYVLLPPGHSGHVLGSRLY